MAQDSPSRHLAQFQLRLPEGMRDKLKDAAKKQNRTVNAEIVKRLEFTFEAEVVAHELGGYDVGLSIGTPEWAAAIQKRDGNDGGRQMSDADLDYIVEGLVSRFNNLPPFNNYDLKGGGSLELVQRARKPQKP